MSDVERNIRDERVRDESKKTRRLNPGAVD